MAAVVLKEFLQLKRRKYFDGFHINDSNPLMRIEFDFKTVLAKLPWAGLTYRIPSYCY